MEIILVLCTLVTVGGIAGRKYFLKRKVTDQAQSVRTPRDLGALVLVERFGQPKAQPEDRDDDNQALASDSVVDELDDSTHQKKRSGPMNPLFSSSNLSYISKNWLIS